MNITLPKRDMERLRRQKNRSAFVAQAVREKLDAEENQRKLRELAEAYQKASAEDADLIDDWDGVAGDDL